MPILRTKAQPMAGLMLMVLAACFAAACAASRPAPPAGPECEDACREMADSCRASCLKITDPMEHIAGSGESCTRTCSTQRAVCEVKCLKARAATP